MREFGSRTTSSAGQTLDRREQILGRRVEGRATVDDGRAEALEHVLHPVPAGNRDHSREAAPEPRALVGDLLVHVGDVLARDLAGVGEQGLGGLGVVGVDVDLQRGGVADHQDGVPERLEPIDERVAVEVLAGDDEVGAEAERRVRVMDLVEARGCVMGDLGELHLLAGEPRDHPANDHHEAQRAGIDDAGRGEDVELGGRPPDGLLAGEQRRRQHLGQQRVLLLGGRFGVEALALPLGSALGDGVGHRPDHGQHGSLGRLADRGVGTVGGVA